MFPAQRFFVTTAVQNEVKEFSTIGKLGDDEGDFFGSFFWIRLLTLACFDKSQDAVVRERLHSF